MSRKVQNSFFLFGMAVLVVMVLQLNFEEVWQGIQRAGYWCLAVIALWAFLYIFNTSAWWIIIHSSQKSHDNQTVLLSSQGGGTVWRSFLWLYKITVSGFALNYATPGGLMGGEPYRVMALKPKIGAERASSSVILYAMTHIFSHFWFWLLSVGLFVVLHEVSFPMGILLGATTLFCVLGIWFFMVGYRRGLAMRGMRLLGHLPLVSRWAVPFIERHRAQLDVIDSQIAALHRQNPVNFVSAVLLELSCRILSSLEIFFILMVLTPEVRFLDCVLILAFTSLFANLLFFIPLQLVGREGGFLMSVAGLGFTASAGIFVALIVRLRELVWTGIGLLFIKIEKKVCQKEGLFKLNE